MKTIDHSFENYPEICATYLSIFLIFSQFVEHIFSIDLFIPKFFHLLSIVKFMPCHENSFSDSLSSSTLPMSEADSSGDFGTNSFSPNNDTSTRLPSKPITHVVEDIEALRHLIGNAAHDLKTVRFFLFSVLYSFAHFYCCVL